MTTTRGMWLTLVAMTLASSMILVDQTAVPLASPDVVQGLGGNIADGQWILTANILPLAAFMAHRRLRLRLRLRLRPTASPTCSPGNVIRWTRTRSSI